MTIAAKKIQKPDVQKLKVELEDTLRGYHDIHHSLESRWINIEDNATDRIATFMFNGTKSSVDEAVPSHAYPNGEVTSVTCLNAKAGDDQQEVYCYAGPGMGDKSHPEFWTKPVNYHKTLDAITGASMEQNTDDAIAKMLVMQDIDAQSEDAVKAYQKAIEALGTGEKGKLTTVNLVGWSRGAVECIKLANKMYHNPYLKHVKVNLVLVDPVPGPGNFDESTMILNNNVNHCKIFYATSERSFAFSPVVPQLSADNKQTKLEAYGLPGAHATLVGAVTSHDKKQVVPGTENIGKIVRHEVEQFLLQHGTKLEQTLNYSDEQLAKLYQQVNRDRAHISTFMKKDAYTFPQLIGKDRKAAHGNKGFFGNYDNLSDAVAYKEAVLTNRHHDQIKARLLAKTLNAMPQHSESLSNFMASLSESEKAVIASPHGMMSFKTALNDGPAKRELVCEQFKAKLTSLLDQEIDRVLNSKKWAYKRSDSKLKATQLRAKRSELNAMRSTDIRDYKQFAKQLLEVDNDFYSKRRARFSLFDRSTKTYDNTATYKHMSAAVNAML